MLDSELGIACVVGTRPEVVKLAPVFLRLKRVPALRVRLIATGQHRGLLDQALDDFSIVSDLDLDLMRPDQSPAEVASRGLAALAKAFGDDPPALVLAVGDTTSVLCSALASFYLRIPFGHVEAGLRTFDLHHPFPEETQRVLVTHLAEFQFAPTLAARRHLLREGISESAIHVTGNTVIDALKLCRGASADDILPDGFVSFLLVTAHRRENFGDPMRQICQAILLILDRDPALKVVWPVHPNPCVRSVVHELLGGHPRVLLTEPLAYPLFLAVMAKSFAVLTDSGGVQEEAPAFGKRVLVLRSETERAEVVESGQAELVGTEVSTIVAAVERLRVANDEAAGACTSPVGDGWASERIARVLLPKFGLEAGPSPSEFRAVWPG